MTYEPPAEIPVLHTIERLNACGKQMLADGSVVFFPHGETAVETELLSQNIIEGLRFMKIFPDRSGRILIKASDLPSLIELKGLRVSDAVEHDGTLSLR
jgi:hypothetical protein